MEILVSVIFCLLYLLLWGCFYWTFIQEARTAYGHPLMVRLTKEQMEDPDVKELLELYRKKLKRYFLIFLLSGAGVLIPVDVLFPVIWTFLMAAAELVFPSKIAEKTRNDLVKLKAEKGWKISGTLEKRKIDLKLDRRKINRSMISLYWYLIPTAFFAGTVLYAFQSRENRTIFLLLAVLGFVLMAAGILFIIWLPNKTWCENTQANQKLNGWKKYTASLCWLELSITDGAIYFATALFLEKDQLISLFLEIFFVIVSLLCVVIQLKEYQSAKDQLLAQEKVYAYDEDDYWSFGIWGLRYYNPYDPQVLKENNSGGLNQTVNMAQASGKWMAAGTILFLAVISLFVAWQFAYPAWLDRQGKLADMEIQADTLKVESPLYKAEIPVEEIMRAELSYDLGEGSKTNGSATGHYGAGKFRYDRYGDVTVYAAWKHKPYLILFAKDEVYIINDDDPEVTLGIYEKVSRGKEVD